MSMQQVRNIKAKCLAMNSDAEIVLHEVSYQFMDSGVWIDKTVKMYATDPQDAIDTVIRRDGVL